MNYHLFWIRVLKVIKMRKLSKNQLAEHIGISPETLRSWVYWNHIPDVVVACRISEFLRVSVEYLVGGRDYAKSRISENQNPENLIPEIKPDDLDNVS